MSLGQTALGLEREGKAPPYKIVMGHDGPLMLECKSLNVSMSLQRVYEHKEAEEAGDDIARREFGEVARGLRGVETARDAIDALAQAFKTGVGIEPIKVLARRELSNRWGSTGFVVDGAIRVQAALKAGIAEIPVWLVSPHFPDTPLEGMFLHYNWGHGARLTVRERDTALRIIADRYIRDALGERGAVAFGRWLAERAPALGATLIAELTRNRFQVRTPDQWEEAARLGRGGTPTAQQVAKLDALGIQISDHRGLSPSHIARLVGVSRAAVEKQFRKLGIESTTKTKPAGKDTKPARPAGAPQAAARGNLNGHTPDATPLGILESEIQAVDARATAQDLLAALKPIASAFDRATRQINDWVLKEAVEYRFEQAKLVWNVVDPFWSTLLTLNQAFRAYQDRHLAERDCARLKEVLAQVQLTLASPRRRGRVKQRSRRAAR